jgi:hypothetical protein
VGTGDQRSKLDFLGTANDIFIEYLKKKGGAKMKTKLILSAMVLVLLAFSSTSIAGVSVNIGVSLPPLVIPGPPVVAVIPGTDAYFCPDVAMDVFFYNGYWYRSYEGGWYRGVGYNGPWGYLAVANVPTVFLHLPTDYRAVGYQRIPYGDLNRNWRAWQRDRYWEHHAWGRNDLGRGREMGRHEVGQYRGVQRGERGGPSMHREMGVAPRYGEHHAPAFGHTGPTRPMNRTSFGHAGHTGPMNRTSTPRASGHRGR